MRWRIFGGRGDARADTSHASAKEAEEALQKRLKELL